MFRLLRFLTGVALLPLCVAVTLALLDILGGLPHPADKLFSPETTWLLTGYFLWLAMWFFLPQPVKTYVVAHELTHALWGLIFGARVSRLKVTDKGGSVNLSKSNMMITLAPYFFPLYTVIVILAHWGIGLFVKPMPLPLLWLFLVGLTWSFHVCFTIQSLTTEQPDVNEYGRIFSYVVIYLFNLAGVGLWIACTTSASFDAFSLALVHHTSAVYASVSDEIRLRYTYLHAKVLIPIIDLLHNRA